VHSGALDLDSLAVRPEDEAAAAISALHGFGRWSAEIYLLFALSRTDSWPADDLALQIGMQRLKGLDMRPDRKTMDVLAEPWRPLRGCGAIFLWHFYGASTLD
jgi:DNA-3-methyladenine glycosylase II